MVDTEMIHQEYNEQIDEFERELQKVSIDISSGNISESISPEDLWSKAETSVTLFKELTKNLREIMFIMKPEKNPIIKQVFKATIQPLNAFKEILFRKTPDPLANSKLAIEALRKAMDEGNNFLDLAKDIRDNPSPIIQEILKLREVYETKEYLGTVQAPGAFQIRLNNLIDYVEVLSASLSNLEKALDAVKECINNLRENSQKFRTTSN